MLFPRGTPALLQAQINLCGIMIESCHNISSCAHSSATLQRTYIADVTINRIYVFSFYFPKIQLYVCKCPCIIDMSHRRYIYQSFSKTICAAVYRAETHRFYIGVTLTILNSYLYSH